MPRPAVDQGRFLSREERYEIARLCDAGAGVRRIARAVGRDPGTISRELARNGNRRTGRYEPERAHTLAHQRQRRPRPRKLAGHARLREWVQGRLDVQDSPEQIAGRLPVAFPDQPDMRISHEAIYQAIYVRPVGQYAARCGAIYGPGGRRGRRGPPARRRGPGRGGSSTRAASTTARGKSGPGWCPGITKVT